MADGIEHIGECSRADPSELGLELREGHFDGVEVGAVGRQEEEPTPCLPYRPGGVGVLVRCQVVENDHVVWGQFRDQHFFDIGREGGTIHCPLDDPGCDHGIGGEPRDEGLCPPRPEWRVHDQAIPTLCPSPQPGHVRLHRRFVNEDNAFWVR